MHLVTRPALKRLMALAVVLVVLVTGCWWAMIRMPLKSFRGPSDAQPGFLNFTLDYWPDAGKPGAPPICFIIISCIIACMLSCPVLTGANRRQTLVEAATLHKEIVAT